MEKKSFLSARARTKHKSVGDVTSVDQLARLMRVSVVRVLMEDHPEEEDDWLAERTLESVGLTLEKIKEDTKLSDEIPPIYNYEELAKKEDDLDCLLSSYEERLKWMAEGSRNWFGLVKSRSVALLLDCSTKALSDNSLSSRIFDHLHLLLQEQLVKKSLVHLIKFGSNVEECVVLNFTADKFESTSIAEEWIDGCRPSGTCNLLSALKLALKQNVESICCVLASNPDQDCQIIADHVLQVVTGYDRPNLHFVSCGCDPPTRQMMTFLVKVVGGVYHHNNLDEEDTFQDSAYEAISGEMKRVRSALHGVKKLRSKSSSVQGQVDDGLMMSLSEVKNTLLDPIRFLCAPLCDMGYESHYSTFDRVTSQDWIRRHGVEGRGLSLYQLLEPDAYQPKEEYIGITGGTVQSQVLNVMMEVDWWDGTQRRVHVDVPKLEDYIDQLEEAVGVVQDRIEGLTYGSRREFGVVTEAQVVLLVNTSSAMSGHLIELQKSLRRLLQEQFLAPSGGRPHVRKVNIGQFSSRCTLWCGQLQDNTPDNLEAMWKWIAQWLCDGTINLAGALGTVFEMISRISLTEEVGVYVITSGRPDQDKDLLCSFLAQMVCGRRIQLHTVYLERPSAASSSLSAHYHTPEAIVEYLSDIAECGHGRFHHYVAEDVAYGDDIHLIQNELELLQSSKHMALEILERFHDHCQQQSAVRRTLPVSSEATPTSVHIPPPLYPRHTLTTVARLNLSADNKLERSKVNSKLRKKYPSLSSDVFVEGFYVGKSLKKGFILSDVDKSGKKKNKQDLQTILTKAVTKHCSSAKWLEKYSLDSLGLSLPRYKSGGPKQKMFMHPTKQGGVVHLALDRNALVQYSRDLKLCQRMFEERLTWITTESRQWFGCISGKVIIFLLDTSSSTSQHLTELTRKLYDVVLEQLLPRGASFNCATFGGAVQWWRSEFTIATRDVLVPFSNWLKGICCHGNTRLLDALEEAVQHRPNNVYVISDGHQDHTEEYFFKKLSSIGDTCIHPVGLSVRERTSCNFLKKLAERTGGSYHSSYHINEGDDEYLGDDIKLIREEIKLTRQWLNEVQELF